MVVASLLIAIPRTDPSTSDSNPLKIADTVWPTASVSSSATVNGIVAAIVGASLTGVTVIARLTVLDVSALFVDEN